MRYRMLALDLDGTLLDVKGCVSDANRRAVRDAMDADVLVVPCTGRSWVEARRVLHDSRLFTNGSPGVFVTGAMVHHVADGRVLDRVTLEPTVIRALLDELRGSPDAVLLFRDADQVGHDYLVTGGAELDANTRWWFEHNQLRWQTCGEPTDAELSHSLRVQVVGPRDRVMPLWSRVRERVGDRVYSHCFEAVQMPDPADNVYILEMFAAGVDKWRGLRWVADANGIDTADVAAIGDEINDLHMLHAAGCAIAMGNAVPEARSLARYVTEPNDADGVARAIRRLLDGEWT